MKPADPMGPREAKRLLLLHSGMLPDETDDPCVNSGFLGHLRPYQGTLNEPAFHEVMAAIKALAPTLSNDRVDRDVMSALWAICYLGRSWAIDPDGMLRRNHLITDADVSRMADWINAIEYAVMILLEQCAIEEAFNPYEILRRKS